MFAEEPKNSANKPKNTPIAEFNVDILSINQQQTKRRNQVETKLGPEKLMENTNKNSSDFTFQSILSLFSSQLSLISNQNGSRCC